MPLSECPHCGQTYNPRYMRYCARCGEAVPDAHGKLPAPGPMDGMGARGGVATRKLEGVPPAAADTGEAPPSRGVSQAVEDMALEYQNRLNEKPEDHDTRYSLALAYLYAGQWERAEAELTLVTEGLPEFADAHARLAMCRARRGDVAGGLQAARVALGLQPEDTRLQGLVARLEQKLAG